MSFGLLDGFHSIATPATVAQHLLMLFLVLIGPVWDWFETRELRVNPSSTARLAYYRSTVLWLWTSSCVAIWSTGWQALFTLHGLGIRVAWLQANRWAWWLVTAVLGLVVFSN